VRLDVAASLSLGAGAWRASGFTSDPPPARQTAALADWIRSLAPVADHVRVGAENPVTSCDVHVLVQQAAEPVASQRSDGRAGGWRSDACGRALMQRSVRTVHVVVLDILAQHCSEVARSGDQEVVEAFAAQRAIQRRRSRSPAAPGPVRG
jgi:hypothetical protein